MSLQKSVARLETIEREPRIPVAALEEDKHASHQDETAIGSLNYYILLGFSLPIELSSGNLSPRLGVSSYKYQLYYCSLIHLTKLVIFFCIKSKMSMDSNDQFLNEHSEPAEIIADGMNDSTAESGFGTIAAQVAGAVVGGVVGGKVAGKAGTVVGAVVGAVAGGLVADNISDEALDKAKDIAARATDKVKEAAQNTKPAIEPAVEKAKSAALNAADKVDIADRAKPSIEHAADTAESTAFNAVDKLEETADKAKADQVQKDWGVVEPAG